MRTPTLLVFLGMCSHRATFRSILHLFVRNEGASSARSADQCQERRQSPGDTDRARGTRKGGKTDSVPSTDHLRSIVTARPSSVTRGRGVELDRHPTISPSTITCRTLSMRAISALRQEIFARDWGGVRAAGHALSLPPVTPSAMTESLNLISQDEMPWSCMLLVPPKTAFVGLARALHKHSHPVAVAWPGR